jgi:hypothetical protein
MIEMPDPEYGELCNRFDQAFASSLTDTLMDTYHTPDKGTGRER